MSCFVAWMPDEDAQTGLMALREEIEASLGAAQGYAWRSRAKLHMTLRFLGHVLEDIPPALEQSLADIAGDTARIALRFDHLESWPGAKALVARPADSDALASLLERIDVAATHAGFTAHAGRQTPHVTLAYAEGRAAQAAVFPVARRCDAWLGHISIVTTEPAGYAVRTWWPLQDAPRRDQPFLDPNPAS